MTLKAKLIVIGLFCFLTATSQTTDSLLANFINNLRTFYELNPLEKCFLHTDKDFYQPGETIWFKTYVTINDKTPSLSNVVYTDLTDINGTILNKAMWKAEKSTAEGSIFLPDTIQTGIYRIRSYTLWMLNEPTVISEQFIFVLGKKDQAKSYYVPETNLTAAFFPEGGSLINSVNNRIAFRITDANKIPADGVKAMLVDEKKEVIASPLVFENGVGMFEFVPVAGKNYQLHVTRNLNNQSYIPLPVSANDGMNLIVSNLSASKVFIQANATDAFSKKNKEVFVIAQQNGQTAFVKKFNFEDAQNAAIIQKKELIPGLMQVIAFTANMEPVAERWIWVHSPSDAKINLFTDTISFEPKGKNKYTISFSGRDTPDISVAVIPADLPSYDFIQQQNIKSYQLIHSNNTSESFMSKGLLTKEATAKDNYLDALLLTIQPKRYTWENIYQNKQSPLTYFFETGISVRGFIKRDKLSMLSDSSKVDAITKGADSSTILSSAKINGKGSFAINDLHFKKRATIYLQAFTKEKKKKSIEFELLPGYIDTLSQKIQKSFYNPDLKPYTTAQKKNEFFVKNYSVSTIGKELTEIVIKGKNKKELRLDSLNTAYTSEIFRNSEYTREPDPNFSYTSFAQLFQQEFFGLRFNLGYDRVSGLDGTPASGIASGDLISYYLNEQPISPEELNFIDPNDVALVKVNRNTNLHLGQMGSGPSVLIYTKSRSNRGKLRFDARELTGYSIPLQFHNPNYLNSDLLKIEDRRTTLLWQPKILFNTSGKASIEFYNNDYTKRYKIVIQGIDKNGQTYYIEKIIE
jgi:hypothetical protein